MDSRLKGITTYVPATRDSCEWGHPTRTFVASCCGIVAVDDWALTVEPEHNPLLDHHGQNDEADGAIGAEGSSLARSLALWNPPNGEVWGVVFALAPES